MKTIKKRFRKGTALLLACTMMAGVVTAMPGNIATVKAASEEPSVTAYATKDQLMDGTFAPDGEGKSTTVAKLIFGKNSSDNPQEWYILGKDSGVSGDNTIIFATDTFKNQQFFNRERDESYEPNARINITAIQNSDSDSRKTLIGTYSYTDSSTHDVVYINHYGISSLRVALRAMAEDTSYFSETEQTMMNATKVTTSDFCNNAQYTTEDKLYAPSGEYRAYYCSVGSGDSKKIHSSIYFDNANNDKFWTRSPVTGEDAPAQNCYYCNGGVVMTFGNPGQGQGYLRYVNRGGCVRPVTNLNLTNVLFASAAKAASSNTPTAGTISSGTAMTLRLNGSNKKIGAVVYNDTTGEITAQNATGAAGPVSLVIQGKNDGNDWFYSVKVDGKTVVTTDQIKTACNISDLSLANCKIWLETTIDNVTYAKEATTSSAIISSINAVEVSDVSAPVANADFDWEGTCNTPGIATTKPAVTYLYTDGNGNDVEVSSGKADWNRTYKAKITLAAGAVDNTIYEFGSAVSVTINGVPLTGTVTPNSNGTLTIISNPFENTAKRKIVSVTAPNVPANNTFTTYFGYNGYDESPISGSNSGLGTQANVTFEASVSPTEKPMNVTWTIENAAGGTYDNTHGASNIFRWTIPASEFADYNVDNSCTGYDSVSGTITGTVTITNKDATPVNITGTDSSIEYTGADIDVSQYFSIDTNAGTATYTDITSAGDGMGIGTLNGSLLTVTQTGEFQIKVNTAPNGIYAAGEENITLTVDNGNIQYTISDYSGNYDGQPHSITLAGLVPDDAIVTYSTDGATFDAANPAFTNVGTYTVYYSIFKDNYNTSNGSKTVTINKKPVTIKADEQKIIYGNVIDQSKYTSDGLATGDSIADVTLSPSTSAITDNGTISVSDVKIVNAAGEDVTDNYDITTVNGTLKIVFDYQIIDGTNSSYTAGSGNELSIRGNGEFSKFIGVKVDGNLIDPGYYTATEGSTIITLKASYMNTLSAGSHTIEILWTDGSASTTFTINANPADNNSQSSNDSANQNNNSNNDSANNSANQNNNSSTNVSLQNNVNKKDAVPKTGDTTPVAGLFVLTIISGIGLLVTEKRAKKDC